MRKQATTSLIMFLSSSFATLLVVIPLLLHSFAVVIGNGGTGAVILAAAVSQPSDIPPYVYPERRPKYPKTSVKERLALIDLHTATRGARWKVKWDTSGGPCSHGWYGVICSREGHVISLSLPANDLRGQIPSSFTDLKYIQVVDLSSNFLSGPLPENLELLSKAERVDLSKNHLTGDPTMSGLWTCPLLESVGLHSNKFDPFTVAHLDPIDQARTRGVLVSLDVYDNGDL